MMRARVDLCGYALFAWVGIVLLASIVGCEGAPSGHGPEPENTAPVITAQPESRSVTAGTSVTFQVIATGSAPLAYRWQRNETDIPGATTSAYSITAATTQDSGTRFRVVVSNKVDAVTSAAAVLTVTATGSKPAIGNFSASPPTISAGGSATLSWSVTGATSLQIDPTPGVVTGNSVSVAPAGTTTYTLSATNDYGTTTAQTRVTVETSQPGEWTPIAVTTDTGQNADVYAWLDTSKQLRTVVLARNDVVGGGVLRQIRYHLASGAERVVSGTNANGWNGHGYIVHHSESGGYLSQNDIGKYRKVFSGPHHTIHQFTFDYSLEGTTITATIHWFMATGQDHPVFAVNFHCSSAPSGNIDSRTPYGDMEFDGDGNNNAVSGVGWGDNWRFTTTGSGPMGMDSSWTYNQANVVPYVREWINSPDAEEGLVQTLSWDQERSGGTWFYDNWQRTSANPYDPDGTGFVWDSDNDKTHVMPVAWNWPYQLNQYELPFSDGNRSKRMAWGLRYGAVGRTVYDYGDQTQTVGYPDRGYSVYEVYGIASTSAVLAQVAQVEHQLAATLTATTGQLVSQGPGGVGRTDSVAYAKAGYNQIYGAFEVTASAAGAATLSLEATGGPIVNPIFLVRSAKGLPSSVKVAGTSLTANQGYFASYDSSSSTLWLTIHQTWSEKQTLEITP